MSCLQSSQRNLTSSRKSPAANPAFSATLPRSTESKYCSAGVRTEGVKVMPDVFAYRAARQQDYTIIVHEKSSEPNNVTTNRTLGVQINCAGPVLLQNTSKLMLTSN
jgi:hypothetical protein